MTNDARDMLKLNYKLGHMPFTIMHIMALNDQIPKQFVKYEVPLCSACLYVKQTCRPWRQKPHKQKFIKEHKLEPGDVISVNQMVSPTPGLVAQMTGILTTKRYKYATVYVGQAS